MTKDSIYELQKIDCNCNDCAFLIRDIKAYEEALRRDKELDLWLFENKKQLAIYKAMQRKLQGKPGWEELLKNAESMKHVYTPPSLSMRGFCSKKQTGVTFRPNTCQIDTQRCFVHRKDIK